MKAFLFFFFLNLNVLAVDFNDYRIVANDYEEMKMLTSKMQCEAIEKNLAKNCTLRVKFKIKEDLELMDSLIFIKPAFASNRSSCFRKYGLTNHEKKQKEFEMEIDFLEEDIPSGSAIEISIDYLKLKEKEKVIEKGEKKYIEFCKKIGSGLNI